MAGDANCRDIAAFTPYPNRQQFFATKVCKALVTQSVAMELGVDTCYLITVVVHKEDELYYRGPVKFWNDNLQAICGFGGKKRLVRARAVAIENGWLHYEPGTKHKAGCYWVTLPEEGEERDSTGVKSERLDDSCRGQIDPLSDPLSDPPSDPPFKPKPKPKPKKGKAGAFDPLRLEVPNGLEDSWQEWTQHRREIKKPLTPTSAKQQIKQFSEWGVERSKAAIDHTILNGWQGLREPDGKKQLGAGVDALYGAPVGGDNA